MKNSIIDIFPQLEALKAVLASKLVDEIKHAEMYIQENINLSLSKV
jgi:hypothetical protein